MSGGQEHIPCPRCSANNMIGHAQCWQCGASLPPPEAIGWAAQGQPAPQGAPWQGGPVCAPQRGGFRAWMVLAPIIVVAALAIGIYMLRSRAHPATAAVPDSLQAQIDALKAMGGTGNANAGTLGSGVGDGNDETRQKAQNEIRRLEDKLNNRNRAAVSNGDGSTESRAGQSNHYNPP